MTLLLATQLGCETVGLVDYANMTPEEKLYRAKCGSCHKLRDPKSETDEDWVTYVHEYGEKCTEQQKAIIIAYLQANN